MTVARILAIRLGRLGDVTLLLPALRLLTLSFPGSRLTLLTSAQFATLADLCPWVDETISLDRLALRDGSRHRALSGIAALIGTLRRGRFDLAVDFHSFRETNLMARVSGARLRLGMRRADRAYLPFCFNLPPAREDKGIHVAEMFRRVALAVPGVRDPGGLTGPSIRVGDREGRPAGFTVALYVGASVPSRRWPAACFAELATHLAERWGASVRVLSGNTAGEEADAVRVVRDAAGSGRVGAAGRLGISALAREIASAGLLVSNDSGPMHLGSALGTPTLGLFSDSLPEHYHPVGAEDRWIRGVPIEAIGVSEVLEVLEEMRGGIPN